MDTTGGQRRIAASPRCLHLPSLPSPSHRAANQSASTLLPPPALLARRTAATACQSPPLKAPPCPEEDPATKPKPQLDLTTWSPAGEEEGGPHHPTQTSSRSYGMVLSRGGGGRRAKHGGGSKHCAAWLPESASYWLLINSSTSTNPNCDAPRSKTTCMCCWFCPYGRVSLKVSKRFRHHAFLGFTLIRWFRHCSREIHHGSANNSSLY